MCSGLYSSSRIPPSTVTFRAAPPVRSLTGMNSTIPLIPSVAELENEVSYNSVSSFQHTSFDSTPSQPSNYGPASERFKGQKSVSSDQYFGKNEVRPLASSLLLLVQQGGCSPKDSPVRRCSRHFFWWLLWTYSAILSFSCDAFYFLTSSSWYVALSVFLWV